MLTREVPIDLALPYKFEIDIKKIIFFDIETTGFSADTSYLYLIGCIYYRDSSFHLIQWFSESIREEEDLVTAFFEFIKDYEALIHFNGSGFDIPFLLRKCSQLKLEYSFDKINSIDIYRKILPYKKIFQLKSYKQKSIEAFFKIRREDKFDGGELIEVYQHYLGKKRYEALWNKRNPEKSKLLPSEAETLLHQLLLHNEDDIKGLVKICPILNFIDIFEKPQHIIKAAVQGGAFIIQFELSEALPTNLNFRNRVAELTASGTMVTLSIPFYEGELKYFYENYKDYFYLPAENTVVHKSLASYVDKDHKVKAKPSNCYTIKSGRFVPQYETFPTPSFKFDYLDKISYIEIHTDFLLREENLQLYVSHILSHLLQVKE